MPLKASNGFSAFPIEWHPFILYRTALNTNLKIEREWRTSLQEESVKDKERIGAMQMELKQLEKLKKVVVVLLLFLELYETLLLLN